MHADPLVRRQQLDDWQGLPGQGIAEAGEDVLLAHQLRIRDDNSLALRPEPPRCSYHPGEWGGRSATRGREPGAKAIHLAGPQRQRGRRASEAGGVRTAEGCRGASCKEGPGLRGRRQRPALPGEGWGAAGQALPTETLPSRRVSTTQARQSGGLSGTAHRNPCAPQDCAPPAAIAAAAAAAIAPAADSAAAAHYACAKPQSVAGEVAGLIPPSPWPRLVHPGPAPGLAAASLPAATLCVRALRSGFLQRTRARRSERAVPRCPVQAAAMVSGTGRRPPPRGAAVPRGLLARGNAASRRLRGGEHVEAG